jgi:hypothetical protein
LETRLIQKIVFVSLSRGRKINGRAARKTTGISGAAAPARNEIRVAAAAPVPDPQASQVLFLIAGDLPVLAIPSESPVAMKGFS